MQRWIEARPSCLEDVLAVKSVAFINQYAVFGYALLVREIR